MRDEGGYTLIELMVGMMVSLVVLGAILAMVEVATRAQDRTAERVYANQRGRPVMTRIVDRLHAACIAPGLAPVREGSSANTLILYSKSGAAVNPTPDKYAITVADGAISEALYPATGGEAPSWEFSETPSSSVQLLDGIAEAGDPPGSLPPFRYFAYEDQNKDGEVDTVPLAVPLSLADAARTVRVEVAFTVAPHAGGTVDAGAPVTLTDAATLRIEPASEDSAKVNLPCV